MTRFALFEPGEPRVGVILGTGPSLTADVLEQVRGLRLFGVNNTYQVGVDVHLACNVEWWDQYAAEVALYRCAKWIAVDDDHPERAACAARYGLNSIRGAWGPGLSTDPGVIHYHHGSGPQMVNLAYHYGCEVMLLVGWDMRYSATRHYFGEYPPALRHFPRTGPRGELAGLIREMETIKPADYGIEIINCTPGSALTCFPSRCLSDALNDFGVSTA